MPEFKPEVVLLEPEIPQNTGNIARTCAALGCRLHLIGPLGFSLSDRYLRRAGLDYWHMVEVVTHPNIQAFFKITQPGRFLFFSRKGERSYHEADYSGTTYLFFGKESIGLPDELIGQYPHDCWRIPIKPEARSLNVSNAVAIVLYEAFRQNNFLGLP